MVGISAATAGAQLALYERACFRKGRISQLGAHQSRIRSPLPELPQHSMRRAQAVVCLDNSLGTHTASQPAQPLWIQGLPACEQRSPERSTCSLLWSGGSQPSHMPRGYATLHNARRSSGCCGEVSRGGCCPGTVGAAVRAAPRMRCGGMLVSMRALIRKGSKIAARGRPAGSAGTRRRRGGGRAAVTAPAWPGWRAHNRQGKPKIAALKTRKLQKLAMHAKRTTSGGLHGVRTSPENTGGTRMGGRGPCRVVRGVRVKGRAPGATAVNSFAVLKAD